MNVLKKICLITAILCLLSGIRISALEEPTDEKQIIDYATEQAEQYVREASQSDDMWKGMTIGFDRLMYGFQDEISGVLFRVYANEESVGYISVFNYDGTLEVGEASIDGAFPYSVKGRLYSVAPLFYFEKQGSDFINIADSSNYGALSDVTTEALDLSEPDEPNAPVEQIQKVEYKLPRAMTALKQPTGNTCTQTAAAMMLRYMDTYKYPNLIANGVSNSTLITTLRKSKYIGDGTTTLRKLNSGLKAYYGDKGYTSPTVYFKTSDKDLITANTKYKLEAQQINTIVSYIKAELPVIVIVGSNGYVKQNSTDNPVYHKSTLHSVTVIGVRRIEALGESTNEGTLIALDPWLKRKVELKWDIRPKKAGSYFAIYSVTFAKPQ